MTIAQTEMPLPLSVETLGQLVVTLDYRHMCIALIRSDPEHDREATLMVQCARRNILRWELHHGNRREASESPLHGNSIRAHLGQFEQSFPVDPTRMRARRIPIEGLAGEVSIGKGPAAWRWIEEEIARMGHELSFQLGPLGRAMQELDELAADADRRELRRAEKATRRQAELEERIRRRQQQMQERRRRQRGKGPWEEAGRHLQAQAPVARPVEPKLPIPPVIVTMRMDLPRLEECDTPPSDLGSYLLRERAALWWISNQSDDLLALPHCKIEHLEYQIRTALRVIGPLRGRALLSDEVGLGKTVEAGIVLKEYLTRGMVRRFLVLTVPSLVDQWEEELSEKFGLQVGTTNHPSFHSNPEAFWRDHHAVVASLHTVKQPAHLGIAKAIYWEMLIVDEAHHLRNRNSQAWRAVNLLPRQFLLLLTATPVQNSLEELYNLVSLLQPGQLPSPKEFFRRFVDRARPHQPREPEELRRLLDQVMVRNTRANAGIRLPPRHAETVMVEAEEAEQGFLESWEQELRTALVSLGTREASMWGRLLLQTIGSSPTAWRQALTSFPDRERARDWTERAALDATWRRKCALLLPLCKMEGGLVIFTQFLATQAAAAAWLKAEGVPTSLINGQTPPDERQPITEEFRRIGGALLLTRSGTEGRNLQFCRCLANLDLPWNPMEIEQRIGRLHRLGQQHPVRIYNLVQKNTLQEHLLQLLQDKLNLFELVVGETGLILGERFSSEEFAEEVLRRWREANGNTKEAMISFGEELAAARADYLAVKQLDEKLFAREYESL